MMLKIYQISFLVGLSFVLYFFKTTQLYQSGDDIGYYMGVIGASMMLLLLLYSVRKRTKIVKVGKMSKWLNIHMLLGLLGPFFILMHSKLSLKSMNSSVAFYAMCAIVISGVIGRFIFKKTNFVLSEKIKNHQELILNIQKSFKNDSNLLALFKEVNLKIKSESLLHNRIVFYKFWLVMQVNVNDNKIFLPFLKLFNFLSKKQNDTNQLMNMSITQHEHDLIMNDMLDYLKQEIMIKEYRFWKNVFSLWHVAHIPFLFLLVLTTVFHIYAVHAY